MNIPDELFETTNSVTIDFIQRRNFWVVKTSDGYGSGHSFEEAFERNRKDVWLTNAKDKLKEFTSRPLSEDQIDALNTFLETNQ